jgi:hypothetical protein
MLAWSRVLRPYRKVVFALHCVRGAKAILPTVQRRDRSILRK